MTIDEVSRRFVLIPFFFLTKHNPKQMLNKCQCLTEEKVNVIVEFRAKSFRKEISMSFDFVLNSEYLKLDRDQLPIRYHCHFSTSQFRWQNASMSREDTFRRLISYRLPWILLLWNCHEMSTYCPASRESRLERYQRETTSKTKEIERYESMMLLQSKNKNQFLAFLNEKTNKPISSLSRRLMCGSRIRINRR